MTPTYRADIDGLRAIAVLVVIFYHSGISSFSGGYVGVDIFFVISGYLITTIIVREIGSDSFSILRFYERRFRRILPVLVVVVVLTLIIGSLILPPDPLIELGKSAMTTAVFASNIFFSQSSGYFDSPAEVKPLLHTWSLAVEEQYYIFFPLLLLLIACIDTRHYLRWLTILGTVSFIVCVIVTRESPSIAFYLIPTRAWELFLGSILALRILPVPANRYIREILSLLGISLIGYSVFRFTSATSFPGHAAALPTLGSALIIYTGIAGQSLIGNLLSIRPVVFIGLISYSLYLWHWPIIVYTKLYSIANPDAVMILTGIGITFILSILSWRFIETPFRNKRFLATQRPLLGASVLASVVILFTGLLLWTANGLPWRYSDRIATILATNDPEWERWKSCEDAVNHIRKEQELCEIGASDGNLSFVVWGDSHAMALASGIHLSAKKHGEHGLIAVKSACPPLLGIDRRGRKSCYEFNQTLLASIVKTPEIETVILVARWALSTKGSRYRAESGNPVQLVDINTTNVGQSSNVELFGIGLARTIDALLDLNKRVVMIGPIPEIGIDVPTSHFIATATGRNVGGIISPTIEEYRERTSEVFSEFLKYKNNNKISIVNPALLLCANGLCSVVTGNAALYRDDNHLSTFGSKLVHPVYDVIFEDP